MNFISLILCLCFLGLLSDAELREDVLQHFVGGDGAAGGDGPEAADGVPELFAQEVGGKLVAQCGEGAVECPAGVVEGCAVAAARDDRVAVVEAFGVDGGAQRAAQAVDAVAPSGRDADRPVGRCVGGWGDVGLVDDRQQRLIGAEREFDRGYRRDRGVDETHDDPGALDAGQRALDAHAFEPVVGGADARRVEEPEADPVDVDALLDHVARRAGDLRDHRPILAQQAVEERRFADVRRADQRDGDTLLDRVAQPERVVQAVDLPTDALHRLAQLPAVGELHILLREIQLQFQQGDQLQQPVAQPVERRRVAAAQLCRGQRMGRARRGGDQIGDGLGLREVELSGQIGADGEFARLGHAGSGRAQQAEHLRDDVGGAVAREFDRILARVGVRRAEEGRQHVVDRAVAVDDAAVVHAVARGCGEVRAAAEDAVAERRSAGAADADDGDGAARRRGGGDDDVVIGRHVVIGRRGPLTGAIRGSAARHGACGGP